MFCPECGTRNPDQAVFCENCGTKININMEQSGKASTEQKKAPGIMSHGEDPVKSEVLHHDAGKPVRANEASVPGYPRKPVSKVRKLILAELLLLAVVCFSFYKLGMASTSPQRVALEFVQNVNDKDWNAIYDRLWIMEDKFTSREMMVKGLPSGDPVKAKNYSISDIEISENGKGTVVWVDFMVPGMSESTSIPVSLVKDEEKRFFLFDTWKVVPDFMAYDYEVKVPKGSKVTLGGILLDDSYLVEKDDYISYYSIPAIFAGDYEILVSQEPLEDYVEQVNTAYGYFSLQDLYLSNETQKDLMERTGKIFEETYEAAFVDKDFNDISHLFQGEKTKTNPQNAVLKEEYEVLAEYLRVGIEGIARRLDVYPSTASTVLLIENDGINVTVRIPIDGEYEENYQGSNYYGSVYGTAFYYYTYTNGEWMITGQDLELNIN